MNTYSGPRAGRSAGDGALALRYQKRFLVDALNLAPIHVTSIRNGVPYGHNCWTEECTNTREEHPFPLWGREIAIGHRYMADTYCIAVHEIPGVAGLCRMTLVERGPVRVPNPRSFVQCT